MAAEEGPPRRRARRRSPSPERTPSVNPSNAYQSAPTLRLKIGATGRDDYDTLVRAIEDHFDPVVGHPTDVMPLFRRYVRRNPEIFSEDALEDREVFRRAVLSNLNTIETGFFDFARNWRLQADDDDLTEDEESDQEDPDLGYISEDTFEGGGVRAVRGHRLYR